MSVIKHFISESIKKTEIDEYLQQEFERAGYGGVDITKTPLGTHVVVYTMRPGIVIGRGGETIKKLAKTLEEKFKMPNPQISVAEVEIPELNANIVASRITSALKRGVHYRRAGFWGLNQIMDAGALGAEVIISGKLRTDRARYEKFRTGYLPKSGEPPRKYMRKAELHVQTKPGILGVKVRLIPPDAEFPDQVKVHVIEEELEKETEGEIVEEKAVTEEKAVVEEPVSKPVAPPAKEKVESEEKVAETKATPAKKKKKVTKKKVAKPKAPAADQKAVKDKKAAKKKTPSAKKKLKDKKKAVKTKAKPAKKKPKAKKKAEPKVAEPAAPAKAKAASKKKAVKTKAKPAKKKSVAKKKVSSAKEKAAPKKKTAKPKVTPAKKKKKVVAKKKKKATRKKR